MDWAPSTNFDDDLVDLNPYLDLIHDQIVNDAKGNQEFIPRPKSTYALLAKREKRNADIDKHDTKTKKRSPSLAMMERIQKVAGTKPLGEHATMSDWDDRSTVEKEAVAMMRHFGMNPMNDGALRPKPTEFLPQGKIHVMRNGRSKIPLILDTKFFEPGKMCKSSSLGTKDDGSNGYLYGSQNGIGLVEHLDKLRSEMKLKSKPSNNS